MSSWSKLQRTSSNGTAITATGDTEVVAAPGAGLHLEIRFLAASNTASTTIISWREGAGGNLLYPVYLNANSTNYQVVVLPVWKLASNTNFRINCTGASGSVHYEVDYEIVSD